MPAVAVGHKTPAGGSRLARRREIINFNWFQIKAQLLLLGILPKCVCGGPRRHVMEENASILSTIWTWLFISYRPPFVACFLAVGGIYSGP